MTDDLVKRVLSKKAARHTQVIELCGRIEALTAENERLRNDHASAVAELNKTKALLKGYRRGYKTARAAQGDTQ